MGSVETLRSSRLLKFYSSSRYSAVTVRLGDLLLPAHRIILAQNSVYFKRAFLGRFPVASSSIIDLGEDDEPDMVRAMIKFMYGGRYIDYSRLPGGNIVEAMVDMFVLADKYDVESLRVSVCNHFTRAMDIAFSNVGKNLTYQHCFITSIIPRICGPSALQLADKTLQQSILDLCKEHWTTLHRDPDFCTLYGTGQLFDGDHVSELGQYLQSLLDSSGKKVRLECWRTIPEPRFEECFEALSDVQVIYGAGEAFFAHKILLSVNSACFNDVLEQSSNCHRITLDRKDNPDLVLIMLYEIYDPDHVIKLDEWAAYIKEMCAVTQKYGLENSNTRHRSRFLEGMKEGTHKPSYPLAVARVCGPDSSAETHTKLSEEVFKRCVEDAKTLFEENKTFLKMLVGGTLFNTKYAGRFAAEMAGINTKET
ncbi:hypothetical protein KCU95_g1825, partial [Aureobasidium melanogenum]